nr:hypothetical protein Iba_chr09bCG14060 [Ipomoea batatas]
MLNPFTLAKSPTKSCLCGRNDRRLSPSLLAQCGGVAGLSAVLEASAAAAAGFSGFGVPFLKDGVKKTKLSLPSLLLRWMRSRSFHRFDQPVELLFFGEDFSAGAAFGRQTHISGNELEFKLLFISITILFCLLLADTSAYNLLVTLRTGKHVVFKKLRLVSILHSQFLDDSRRDIRQISVRVAAKALR